MLRQSPAEEAQGRPGHPTARTGHTGQAADGAVIVPWQEDEQGTRCKKQPAMPLVKPMGLDGEPPFRMLFSCSIAILPPARKSGSLQLEGFAIE